MATLAALSLAEHAKAGEISQRGQQCIGQAPNYLKLLSRIQARISQGKAKLWTDQDRQGYIMVGVAENRIAVDMMLERIAKCRALEEKDCYYQSASGTEELKQATRKMLQATCMKGVDFEARNIAFSTGVLGVLELLGYLLADAGDHCILLAPHYSMFENNLTTRNGIRPARLHPDKSMPLGPQLDKVKQEAEAKGGKVRMFLFSNPDNPTGCVHTEEECLQILKWCADNDVHMVSDELYANSLFDRKRDFLSLGYVWQHNKEVLPQGAHNLVHVINGISKDWALAGLRLGFLVSWNTRLLTAYNNPVSVPQTASSQTQALMAEIFNDLDFVHSYLDASAQLVEKSYRVLAGTFADLGIPHSHCQGAVFVWIDLRHLLKEPTWEAEFELQESLLNDGKMLVSNGKSLFASEPGYFRICYASVPYEAVEDLCSRIRDLAAQQQWSKR